MKKSEILFYAGRRGLCVYEIYKGRRILYMIKIPIFTDGQVIPTDDKDVLVGSIREVKKMADELWEDDEYRRKASAWVRTW